MTSHAKAPSAGSTMRQAKGFGRFFRGAGATRGTSLPVDGSGAPSRRRPLLLLLAAALTAAVLCLGATLASAASREYVKSFGPDGTEASGFTAAAAIAVDQGSELVYVIDRGAGSLLRFDLEGNPVAFTGSEPYISGNEISGLTFEFVPGNSQVAVDSQSHTIYVTSGPKVRAFEASGEPHEFTAGPGAGTSEIEPSGEVDVYGVAVDQSGAIYASRFREGSGERITVYSSAGEVLNVIDGETTVTPKNLAVDARGVVNAVFGGEVRRLHPSEFPVTPDTTYSHPEQVDPNLAYSVAVNPLDNYVYIAEREPARIAVYNEEAEFITSFAGPGQEGEVDHTEGIGVFGDTGRAFVSNIPASGLSQVEIFRPTVAKPTIEESFASHVTGDSATLGATIDPNTLATTYRFEYGPGDCTVIVCTGLPPAGIGSGYSPVEVSAAIAGLQPATTYHFRVVAQNSLGTSEAQRTFTTQGPGLGFALPDARAWEMVSPPDKHGARLVHSSTGPVQAAADGSGLAYQSLASIEADPDGNRAIERSTVLARRAGSAWGSKDLTPPHLEPFAAGGTEFVLFSRDLSSALLAARDDYPLSPQASALTPYLRENGEPPAYTPLVTGAEGFANVPPGTEFGQPGSEVFALYANRDLGDVVLLSEAALVPGAAKGALYRWSRDDGQLQPVSALPGGGAVVTGILGSGQGSARNAVAEDGSRVFWSEGNYNGAGVNTTALYARDLEAGETLRLDAVAGGSGLGEARPVFQGASADGRTVFFTDSRQLTADASPAGRDLYRCQLPPAGQAGGCALTDLTAPRANPGESAAVQGIASALGEDGTTAYFVAQGVLDAEPNEAGESAVPGQPNLYLWDEEAGIRFIATLAARDRADWGSTPSVGPVARAVLLSTAGSPQGRYLSFMSERSLTGYQNRDASSGELQQEVFRYDALQDSLACISCNPTGASPEGETIDAVGIFSLVDQQSLWREQPVAAALPQTAVSSVSGKLQVALSPPRAALDNGRVFFNAIDSLVPADSNGQWDVYQWEPTGLGDCSASTGDASTVRSAGGCVSLLSSGTSEQEAGFLDAGESGDDVFFLTAARLSVTDVDGEYDAYDARVDGVPAVLEETPECLGESCQPAAQAPQDLTPGTATFRGPGNLRPRARCGSLSKRVKVLSRRARAVRRHARAAARGSRAQWRMGRRARRLSHRAHRLGKRAKRCRRAERRAGR